MSVARLLLAKYITHIPCDRCAFVVLQEVVTAVLRLISVLDNTVESSCECFKELYESCDAIRAALRKHGVIVSD